MVVCIDLPTKTEDGERWDSSKNKRVEDVMNLTSTNEPVYFADLPWDRFRHLRVVEIV